MPIVTSSGAYEVGFSRQTNEATVATVAAYAMPVFAGAPQPVVSTNRIEVTDAASIAGDPYKQPDTHWEATNLVVPAFADSLGLLLVSLWNVDTKTLTGPYLHTYSGLAGTPFWMAAYDNFTNATLAMTYEAGICSGMTFSFDESGGPLRVGYNLVGKKPTVATYTKTVTNTLADGYFTAQGATLKFEEDNATPATHTNIQNCAVTIARPVTPMATADGTSVTGLGMGRLEASFTMQMFWETWDAFRNTYFGTTTGTVPVSTFVAGSVELNFVHTVTAGWNLKLTIPKVWMKVSRPDPDPGGAPLTLQVDGQILKPASGDHVQPLLTNAVATSYSA